MTRHEVKAACYGIGAIFPVVVLDAVRRWNRPAGHGVPRQRPEGGHGMLVLRWTGPEDEEPSGPELLRRAAARAPLMPATEAELRAYRRTLPSGLYLVVLPAALVLGAWEKRPGAASAPRPSATGRGPG